MTLAVAVRERLLAQAALTNLVDTRIYTLILPPHPTLPAVRVQTVDVLEPYHARGPVKLFRARVQIDAVAESLAEAEAVDAAVAGDGLGDGASGFAGFTGPVGSPPFTFTAVLPIEVTQTFRAEELRQFRVSRDFFVWYTGE